jgi:hypothetical protein
METQNLKPEVYTVPYNFPELQGIISIPCLLKNKKEL